MIIKQSILVRAVRLQLGDDLMAFALNEPFFVVG